MRIGDAEPVCPACQVLPAYGRVIGALAGRAFGEAEYVAALGELDAAMDGHHDRLEHAEVDQGY